MIIKLKKIHYLFFNLITPISVFAIGEIPSGVQTQGTFVEVFGVIKGIIETVVPILMIAATAVVIWGIIQYVLAGGSDARKKEAKDLIIWGLIGLFVIAGMWGITAIIGTTFGIDALGTPIKPGAPGTFF